MTALPTIPDLPGGIPVVLFPVRIETRYLPDGTGGTNLCCRIYPAAPELDTHEPQLTTDEAAFGSSYQEVLTAATSADDKHAAWLTLCAQLGAPRAAWVARATTLGAPNPGTRAGTWTRPAQAVVLPDFWVALGYRNRTRVFAVSGNPVRTDPMPAGPVPGEATGSVSTGETPLAKQVAWLVDYNTAVTAGMAVTVPLGAGPYTLDRLVMLGAKGLSPADGAARVAQLLDAQRYTGEVSLLPPGTPTNNTPTAPSGYSSADEPLDPAQPQPSSRPGDGSDGSRLAAALGIDPATLTGIPGVDATSALSGQATNALLWPATWGQFLASMVQPTPDDESIETARRMFVDWVRADGPLPTLRLGTQPRGLLPVLTRDALTDATDPVAITKLAELLSTLLTAWTAAGSQYGPEFAPGTELLARTGVGWEITARADVAIDRTGWYQHATAVMGVARAATDELLNTQNDRIRGATYLLGMGLSWVSDHILLPGTADLVPAADGPAYPVTGTGPLTLSGATATDATLPDDYLNQLIAQDRAAMTAETFRPARDTLLYLLARHALLTAVSAVAGDFPRPLPALTPRGGFGTDTGDGDGQLVEALAGAGYLAGHPPGNLSRLVAQTLDLTGNRLDAWLTAFATRRLSAVRSDPATATGVLVGGWGVVENLAPAAPLTTIPQTPAGEAPGLQHDPANAGYLLAPSIAQASTAAVLRSGYLTYRPDDPDFPLDPTGSPLEIDLCSRRVRLVDYLLDGMRQGQQLGALLGYRLERALHDNTADDYIAPFRLLAPLNASRSGVKTDVTDGLALSQLRNGPTGLPWGAQVGSLVLGPELPAVTTALDEIDEVLDAVADALLGEAVHQTLLGNHAAARAAIDTASRGDTPPPELDFVRTPRTGFAVTHRVIVPWAIDPTAPAGWTARARTQAEPAGSAWVASLIGDPSRYAGQMQYTDVGGANVTVAITLADLALSPLDLVVAAAAPNDLAAYAAWVLRPDGTTPAGVSVDATAQLIIRPDGAELTIADALAAAGAIDRLLGRARSLDARDVTAPGATATGIDAADLATRYAAARAVLQDIVSRIATASPAAGTVDRTGLAVALVDAYFCGVPGSAPVPISATDAVVAAQAQAVAAELSRRLDKAGQLADAESQPKTVCAQLQTLLGPQFLVAPACALPTATAVSAAIAATDATTDDAGQNIDAWLGRLAAVRPSLSVLEETFSCGEALGSGPALQFAIGQLPVVAGGAPWVGLPLRAGAGPAANTTSLVFAPGTIDISGATASLAGLVVDEWTEAIPAAQEQVAASFHFDAPGAQAPQSMLLVVPPPNPANAWVLDDFEKAVLDALDLTRARAADLSDQSALTPFLPAAYVGGSTAPWVDPTRLAATPVGFGSYDVAAAPRLDTVATSSGAAATVMQGATQTLIVAGQNLAGATYGAGPDLIVTATGANATGATLTVQAATSAATGPRLLQASDLGGLATIGLTVTPRPLVTDLAPQTIGQRTAAGPAQSVSTYNITVRGQGLTGTSTVAISGGAVKVTQVQVIDDGTLIVQITVADAAPYRSTWDPTEPGGPLKPPRPPAPVHSVVALHLTVTVGAIVLDATATGVRLMLDEVDNNSGISADTL